MWIWIDKKRNNNPVMAEFRKYFTVTEGEEDVSIRITADALYCLFVNDIRVCNGPCKSVAEIRYYDTVSLKNFIHTGRNEIRVRVASYPLNDGYQPAEFGFGPISVPTRGTGGLWIYEEGNPHGLTTDTSYEARREEGYSFLTNDSTLYKGYTEKYDCSSDIPVWSEPAMLLSDDESTPYGVTHFWHLEPRPIPLFYMKKGAFDGVYIRDSFNNPFISSFPAVTGAGSSVTAEIYTDTLKNGYVCFDFSGGACEAEIIYAESYVTETENGSVKNVRDNPYGQTVTGERDIFVKAEGKMSFSPFDMRTFRVIRINITAKDEPVYFENAYYYETGYPLGNEVNFTCDDSRTEKIWDVSVRTLSECMLDTFVDCPYYERMQYAMDTYLEACYSLCISSDTGLIRKAIGDFARSQRFDGLMACNAPARFRQTIPVFNFYWALLLAKLYQYTGDSQFVRCNVSVLDRMICYFSSKIDDNNLIKGTGYWQFFDWTGKYERGCPADDPDVYNIPENLLFAYTLEESAALMGNIGLNGLAEEYRKASGKIIRAAAENAFDAESGLFCDIPGQAPVSCHAQIFAVLSGAYRYAGISPEKLMQNMLECGSLSEPSYAMNYFCLRALEKAGLYGSYMQKPFFLEKYNALLDKHLTTWPESFVDERSDCHGWSALPLYEFIAGIFGITPAEPGYKKVRIAPAYLPGKHFAGTVPAPAGNISVTVSRKKEDTVIYKVILPKGMEYEVCPDLIPGVHYEVEVQYND